jgi:SWI/SNF related-matrix-associated actin-dependent regulator of chromatin subfamily C
MSTPKITFRVSTAEPEVATGDVVTHDVSIAPGKEREREPMYGGDLANLGPGEEGMDGGAGKGEQKGEDEGE